MPIENKALYTNCQCRIFHVFGGLMALTWFYIWQQRRQRFDLIYNTIKLSYSSNDKQILAI